MFLQMIKQLQDEKDEQKVRFEAKVNQMEEKHAEEKKEMVETLKRQEDLFRATLSEMKQEYQERIVFLQSMLAPTPSTEIEAVRSRYFL